MWVDVGTSGKTICLLWTDGWTDGCAPLGQDGLADFETPAFREITHKRDGDTTAMGARGFCTHVRGIVTGITAGTKVNLLDEQGELVKVVKARELAGQTDLLFRRNSLSGAVECKTHKSAIELNEALHAHN